jgi:hypothetical protein
MLLLNVLSTFSPLCLSSGSALFVAKIYTQRISRLWAVIAITVWCVSEFCMGLALLAFMHAAALNLVQSPTVYVGYTLVAAIPLLWLGVSCALVARAIEVSIVLCALNFVAHFVLLGIVFHSSGGGAALFALVGSAWISWTGCFSISLSILLRRGAMKRITDVAVPFYKLRDAESALPYYKVNEVAYISREREKRCQTVLNT